MCEDSVAREIRETTTVNVPAVMDYNLGTPFTDFPRFTFGAETALRMVWGADLVVKRICGARDFDFAHLGADLSRFKGSLEEHGYETGSWSSSVIEGHLQQAVEPASHGIKPMRTIRSHEGGGEDAGAEPVAP